MNDGEPTGSIRVSIQGLEDSGFGSLQAPLGVQVDILDMQLRLKQRARSHEEIELAPGKYVISVTLPDGSRYTDTVYVRSRQTTSIELDWNALDFDTVNARIRPRTGEKALLQPAPTSYYLRFVKISSDFHLTPSSTPPFKQIDEYTREQGVLDSSLIIHAEDEHAVHLAQFAADGLDSVAVALPIAKVGEARTCQLIVAVSGERIEVDIRMRGSVDADAIAQYMSSGQIFQAAVPEAVEELLYGKLQHPFGAALGGYALLRVKQLDRLHDWPRNLAHQFSWLPDSHIILGEQLLRGGEVLPAYQSFRRALDAGLPVFTDGLSILLSRLRSLARGTTLKGVTDEIKIGSQTLLKTMSIYAPWIDFRALYTTLRLRGVEPIISVAEGWQRFRIPFGQAHNSRDFWSDPMT